MTTKTLYRSPLPEIKPGWTRFWSFAVLLHWGTWAFGPMFHKGVITVCFGPLGLRWHKEEIHV